MSEYYIVIDNRQEGPFNIKELELKQITPETLLWVKGMKNWKEAKDFSELQYLFNETPPPIPNNKRDLEWENTVGIDNEKPSDSNDSILKAESSIENKEGNTSDNSNSMDKSKTNKWSFLANKWAKFIVFVLIWIVISLIFSVYYIYIDMVILGKDITSPFYVNVHMVKVPFYATLIALVVVYGKSFFKYLVGNTKKTTAKNPSTEQDKSLKSKTHILKYVKRIIEYIFLLGLLIFAVFAVYSMLTET